MCACCGTHGDVLTWPCPALPYRTITLHYITLHYVTLRYVLLRCIAQRIVLHLIAFALHYSTVQSSPFHCICTCICLSICNAFSCIAWHGMAEHGIGATSHQILYLIKRNRQIAVRCIAHCAHTCVAGYSYALARFLTHTHTLTL